MPRVQSPPHPCGTSYRNLLRQVVGKWGGGVVCVAKPVGMAPCPRGSGPCPRGKRSEAGERYARWLREAFMHHYIERPSQRHAVCLNLPWRRRRLLTMEEARIEGRTSGR